MHWRYSPATLWLETTTYVCEKRMLWVKLLLIIYSACFHGLYETVRKMPVDASLSQNKKGSTDWNKLGTHFCSINGHHSTMKCPHKSHGAQGIIISQKSYKSLNPNFFTSKWASKNYFDYFVAEKPTDKSDEILFFSTAKWRSSFLIFLRPGCYSEPRRAFPISRLHRTITAEARWNLKQRTQHNKRISINSTLIINKI